ncbi:hypothetical protein R3I94_018826 [Phoxinus phoxinus]
MRDNLKEKKKKKISGLEDKSMLRPYIWKHSKPTSWYKFAKRNTGRIVRGTDAGCIQMAPPSKVPPVSLLPQKESLRFLPKGE